jgi:hypothetical protein
VGKQKPYGSKMEKFDVVGRSSRCSQSTDKHLHLVLDKLYFNFYRILLKGYKVIGDIKMYIVVYFGEEKRARAGYPR